LFGGTVGAATAALAVGLYPVGASGAVALFLAAGNLAVGAMALKRIRARRRKASGPWTRAE